MRLIELTHCASNKKGGNLCGSFQPLVIAFDIHIVMEMLADDHKLGTVEIYPEWLFDKLKFVNTLLLDSHS